MRLFMKPLFWFSVIVVLYVYIGYPALVAAWARVVKRTSRRRGFADGDWPSISIVVAARNEATRLPSRVANLLQQRYPGQREIIVVSDGSVDSPQTALAPFLDRIRFIDLPSSGKPAALNAGVRAALGDIVVFADARQSFAPNALTELVSNFADPSVGGVTGELILDCEAGREQSVTAHKLAKALAFIGSTRNGSAGARAASGPRSARPGPSTRCGVHSGRPLPQATLLDDVLAPMRAVLAGFRIVFDEQAIAFDRASADAASEARRKTRTLAGNYQILALEPRLLLPVVNPVWIQYLVAQGRAADRPVGADRASRDERAPRDQRQGSSTSPRSSLQVAFYGLAAAGARMRSRERLARVALTFVMMNYSALAGLAALGRGREVWR